MLQKLLLQVLQRFLIVLYKLSIQNKNLTCIWDAGWYPDTWRFHWPWWLAECRGLHILPYWKETNKQKQNNLDFHCCYLTSMDKFIIFLWISKLSKFWSSLDEISKLLAGKLAVLLPAAVADVWHAVILTCVMLAPRPSRPEWHSWWRSTGISESGGPFLWWAHPKHAYRHRQSS